MEELIYPIYVIEYFYTYCDAVWLYDNGGVDDMFISDNPGETIAIFTWEEDARNYFKKNKCNKMEFFDPRDYTEDSPELGIGHYLLIRYNDDWNDPGTVLEKSDKGLTSRQMLNLFKKSGIDLKELSIKRRKQNGA